MDAANILKPALARGTLRCMGATTLDEFRRFNSFMYSSCCSCMYKLSHILYYIIMIATHPFYLNVSICVTAAASRRTPRWPVDSRL